jgi:LysM repeat protein
MSTTERKSFRLTRRGRVLATVMILSFTVPVLSAAAKSTDQGEPMEVELHVVAPGDTLWGIAAATKEPGQDIRSAISEIKKLNQLQTSTIYVGQTILLKAN